MSTFSHPPLFIALLKVYKQYYGLHQNLPKLFRVSVGDKIMEELGDAMKIVVIANFNKKNETTKAENSRWLLHLRGKIELLKAYFLIGWEMKFISHGFYAAVSDNLEDISKQAYAWSNWIEK